MTVIFINLQSARLLTGKEINQEEMKRQTKISMPNFIRNRKTPDNETAAHAFVYLTNKAEKLWQCK